MGVAGTLYNFGQLQQLWVNAGGSSAVSGVMAAIAMAESSGGASSTNSNTDGSTDYGLWQINSVNGGNTGSFDPTVNAQQAVKVYNQQGLGAWTTYTSGAYQQFMQSGASNPSPTAGTPVVATGTPANVLNPLDDIGSAIGSGLADAITSVMKPFLELAFWGLEVVVGGALMLAAAFIMMQGSDSVKSVEKNVALDTAMAAEPEAAPAIKAEQKAVKSVAPSASKTIKGEVVKSTTTKAAAPAKSSTPKSKPFVEDWGFEDEPKTKHPQRKAARTRREKSYAE